MHLLHLPDKEITLLKASVSYCQTPSVVFENTESDNMIQYSFQSL